MNPRKKYNSPKLRRLGRMQAVTRKSGAYSDTGGWPTRKN